MTRAMVVLMAAVLCVPIPCLGQETVVVKAGEPAPFTGLLVPEDEYTRLIGDQLELQDLRMRLRACQRESSSLEQMYLKRLETATKPPAWYETASFNRWFGFTLGVASASLAVWGASRLQRE